MSIILFIIVIALLAMIISSTVRIVPQAHAYVVERLGAYQGTWSVGLHVKVPFIDRVARKVNLKEQVVDFPPQPVITKDNVTMQIDTVVYFQITDPKLYSYGVENPIMAIENLTATTLRNVIGDLELDETLTSRETINTQMRATLDVATDPWGIKVNRVELKNIIPPAAIQDALHVAAMPPYRIMDACGRALALLEDMADKGSRQLLSDVACGAVFCRAAMQGASLTLFANTTSMKDRARAEELETACDELLDTWLPRADALARRASDAARKRG